MIKTAKAANPRGAADLIDAVITALTEQTVTVPGATATERVLPRLATSDGQAGDHDLIAVQVDLGHLRRSSDRYRETVAAIMAPGFIRTAEDTHAEPALL